MSDTTEHVLFTLDVPASERSPAARYELLDHYPAPHQVRCSVQCGQDGKPKQFIVAAVTELDGPAFMSLNGPLGVVAIADVARCVLEYKRSKIGTGVARG